MINYQLLKLYVRAYNNNMELNKRFFFFKKIHTYHCNIL